LLLSLRLDWRWLSLRSGPGQGTDGQQKGETFPHPHFILRIMSSDPTLPWVRAGIQVTCDREACPQAEKQEDDEAACLE
jgi:hypothetical protein